MNISSALVLELYHHNLVRHCFCPSWAFWSGHGHSAWHLPQVSPVACTRASSRPPISYNVCPYPRGPPGKHRNTPSTNNCMFISLFVSVSSVRLVLLNRIGSTSLEQVPYSKPNEQGGNAWNLLRCIHFENTSQTNQQQFLGTTIFQSSRSNALWR